MLLLLSIFTPADKTIPGILLRVALHIMNSNSKPIFEWNFMLFNIELNPNCGTILNFDF